MRDLTPRESMLPAAMAEFLVVSFLMGTGVGTLVAAWVLL